MKSYVSKQMQDKVKEPFSRYDALKVSAGRIMRPEVQKRIELQAGFVLSGANTMMPDPEAPNSLLPPPLDAIWAALPEALRPNVEEAL